MRAPLRPRSLAAWLAFSVALHVGAVAGTIGAHGLHRDTTPDPAEAARPAPAQAGETFEVPIEEVDRGGPPPSEETAPSEVLPVPAVGERDEGAGHAHPARSTRKVAASRASEGGGGGSTFGAVGDRSAVDVATAFTRGFPQAASADAAWTHAPFGPAGTADVTLVIDETGALIDARTSGGTSPALAAGVRRTLALIRARSFVAERRETHLRVTATVSPDQVHDGLHGDVFAIGGTFDRGEGSGFFALAMGRRIDVKVREVK